MFTLPFWLEHDQKRIENSLQFDDVRQAITKAEKSEDACVNMSHGSFPFSLSLSISLDSLPLPFVFIHLISIRRKLNSIAEW